jgi:hypothetical protein
MDRLLLLRLRATGCRAEALVNGIPVLRSERTGGSLALPVHEYLLEGDNELALVIEPATVGGAVAPRIVSEPAGASLRLLLPRIGQPGSELSARSLAEIDWAIAAGELLRGPVVERRSLALPVKLPRWRWLDAPPLADLPAAQPLVAEFVQNLALSLARGDPEPFLAAARVRFEDLAIAYQQPAAELAARWRARIERLFATKALQPVLPELADVVLRPCAGGRLLECVGPTGEPALRTEPAPDGARHAWPIRVAVVEGRTHIVR